MYFSNVSQIIVTILTANCYYLWSSCSEPELQAVHLSVQTNIDIKWTYEILHHGMLGVFIR